MLQLTISVAHWDESYNLAYI